MQFQELIYLGRGPHESTKIKKDIKYAAKAGAAAEVAALEAKFKTWAKYLPERVQEALMKTLEGVDALELIAVVSLTPIVHEAVKGTLETTSNVEVTDYLFGVLGIVFAQLTPNEERQEAIKKADWFLWIASFGLTYLIVHNFGALLGAGQSVIGIAKALIGA